MTGGPTSLVAGRSPDAGQPRVVPLAGPAARGLDGGGHLSPPIRSRALEEARAAGLLGATPGAWICVGPYNIGGRVTALAVDPGDAGHIWLGTAAGGVFESSDGGVNWTPVFDDQTALAVGSLAAHPTNSDIVYVGTGEDNGGGYSFDGEGLFRTADGGRTWSHMGLTATRRIGRIAIDPQNPDRLYVAAGGDWFSRNPDRGIYRSLDGGTTWEKTLYVADDAGGIDVAIDPLDTSRIYAAIWQRQSLGASWYIAGPESGVWRSRDGGTTWSRLGGGLPAGPDVGRIGLAIASSSPEIVYALIINATGNLLGLYRSADAGDTWAPVNTSLGLSGFSYYFGNVRVDPADPQTVYVLDYLLYRSTDGGTRFSEIAKSVHWDWHDLVILNDRLLGANDAGFFWSGSRGTGWEHAITLPITQIYDLGIDTLQPWRRFIGSQDNGVLRTTTGAVSDWQEVIQGDGFHVEVDPANSSLVYATREYGRLYRSTNGGNSFSWAAEGIDIRERRNWSTPIAVAPGPPTTVYTGAQRLYRSTDTALTWQPISIDLTGGAAAGVATTDVSGGDRPRGPGSDRPDHLLNLVRATITVVDVSPVDARVIWAGTDDGNVWVTPDAGLTWRRVNPAGTPYWVTDIAADPFETDTAYFSVTGYRQGDRLPYVRTTTDLGASWRDRAGGLPQVPVNSLVPDPEWRGRLIAGTDLGVFLTDDGGASWSFLGAGMPRAVVLDLVLHDATRTLYAGTHGRSIYTFDLRQLPPADGDGDGVDNNEDCALADAGAFAAPGSVDPLTMEGGPAGSVSLHWPDLAGVAGTGTLYDVATGSLHDLAASGTAASTSLDCGVASTSASDPSPLPPGEGRYYLVRARNSCGAGGWGTDSGGVERQLAACP